MSNRKETKNIFPHNNLKSKYPTTMKRFPVKEKAKKEEVKKVK